MLDAVGTQGGSNSFSLAEGGLQGEGELEGVSASEERERLWSGGGWVAKGGRGAILSRRWSVFLPRRGRRCLAAERGECGQRSGDKEMS
jgi:hypothetical protein